MCSEKSFCKKQWYVLVEVINDDDKNRDREKCILEAENIKHLNVEEFLNNKQKMKFFLYKAKIIVTVDGEEQVVKRKCCVLQVGDSYKELEKLRESKRFKGPAKHHLMKRPKKSQNEVTTDSDNIPSEIPSEIPPAKEAAKLKKEKTKEEKKRKKGIQTAVMETIRKRFEKQDTTKIEVSLDDWTRKIALIASLQTDVKNLKEECKTKNILINKLERIISSMGNNLADKIEAMTRNSSFVAGSTRNNDCSDDTILNDIIPRGKVDIGGVLVQEAGLTDLRLNKRLEPSKIVRGLASLIFDETELTTLTITGKHCNFNSKRTTNDSKGALDPKKLEALRSEYLSCLKNKGNLSNEDVAKEYANWKKYLRAKMQYEKSIMRREEKELLLEERAEPVCDNPSPFSTSGQCEGNSSGTDVGTHNKRTLFDDSLTSQNEVQTRPLKKRKIMEIY